MPEDANVPDELRTLLDEAVRACAARLCRALRAAGRLDEADAVAQRARALEPGPKMEEAVRG